MAALSQLCGLPVKQCLHDLQTGRDMWFLAPPAGGAATNARAADLSTELRLTNIELIVVLRCKNAVFRAPAGLSPGFGLRKCRPLGRYRGGTGMALATETTGAKRRARPAKDPAMGREQLLRIDGAMRVLSELLGQENPGQGSTDAASEGPAP
jgi:hypothetical protein